MRSRTLPATSLLAVLLVLPAVLFLGSAAVRSMQPAQYQPAHAAQVFFDTFVALPVGWFSVLLGLAPSAALILSAVVAWRHLTSNPAARDGLGALIAGLRRIARQPTLVAAALAFVGAAGVLLFAVEHWITG